MADLHSSADHDDSASPVYPAEVFATNQQKELHVASHASDDHSTAPTKPSGIFATCLVMLATVMPAGGMLATSFNMASTAIGAGILGLPAATGSTGYIMTLIYLIAITAETVYSMVLLVEASQLCGERTYERMANKLFFHGADYMVAAIRFVYCFGCCIAYVICVMNLVTPILTDDNESDPSFWHNKSTGVRLITFIFFSVSLWPTSTSSLVWSAPSVEVSLALCFLPSSSCMRVAGHVPPLDGDTTSPPTSCS